MAQRNEEIRVNDPRVKVTTKKKESKKGKRFTPDDVAAILALLQNQNGPTQLPQPAAIPQNIQQIAQDIPQTQGAQVRATPGINVTTNRPNVPIQQMNEPAPFRQQQSPAIQQLAQNITPTEAMSPREGMVMLPGSSPIEATGLNALQQQPQVNPQVQSLFSDLAPEDLQGIQQVFSQIPPDQYNNPQAVNKAVQEAQKSKPLTRRQKVGNFFRKALPIIGTLGGAIAGFVTGGPAGAFAGSTLGATAGSAGASLIPNANPEGSVLSGTPGSFQREPIYNPEQIATMDALRRAGYSQFASQGNFSPLQDLLSQQIGQNVQNRFNFEPFRQKYERKFAEETLPGIFERFTSLGKGAQSTGAFQGMLARGGAELNEGLAALEQDYALKNRPLDLKQQQLLQSLLGQQQGYDISKRGLGLKATALGTRPLNELAYNQPQQGFIQSVFPEALKAGATIAGKVIENKYFPQQPKV